MCSYVVVVQSLLVFFVCAAGCDIILNEFNTDIDQCKDVCSDSFFLLPKGKETQDVCQRGCRFFNIIYLKDDHDLNVTKEECYLSCDEAYDDGPRSTCRVGCDAASKKKQSEASSVLVFIDQDAPRIVLVEPDLELIESDLVSDPLIQSQIEIGYNVEYKIPETKVRTMPIEELVETVRAPSGDWLDCASRNSGVPKWMLLSAILGAILVALWLSISSERKVIGDGDELVKNEEVDEEQADELPVKADVEFSAPPKYSVESEKV